MSENKNLIKVCIDCLKKDGGKSDRPGFTMRLGICPKCNKEKFLVYPRDMGISYKIKAQK